MVICKVGTGAATATVGDTVIVPCTQSAPDGNLPDGTTAVNNPLPFFATDLGSSRAGFIAASNSNARNLAVIAGSD